MEARRRLYNRIVLIYFVYPFISARLVKFRGLQGVVENLVMIECLNSIFFRNKVLPDPSTLENGIELRLYTDGQLSNNINFEGFYSLEYAYYGI